ncbi:MAG: hypothetical protein AAF366_10745 [Pseudomonadota bacterium]
MARYAHGSGSLEHAAADHGPAGLVAMGVRRANDGDLGARLALAQAGRHGDVRRAATADHHFEIGIGLVGGGLAAIGDAPHDAIHVVARRLRGGEDLGQVELSAWLRGQNVVEWVPVRQ